MRAHVGGQREGISPQKELVGLKANGGREYQPKGRPQKLDSHDFPDPEMPKAIPYGVYDLAADEGFVSVGDHHDTAAFAVAAIRRWWATMGSPRYPDATRLLITADAGGSNSCRSRLLLRELAAEREAEGLTRTVVAARMGTSESAVARLEKGEADAKLSTVGRYAAALGKRVEWRIVDQAGGRRAG